jgi:hypothetical protein
VIHGLAPDVGDLLAGQIGHLFQLWNGLDQIIDGKCSGFVTGLGTVACAPAIVPPVARTSILGLAWAAVETVNASIATRQRTCLYAFIHVSD